MDTSFIVKAAMSTVGIIQLLKNFIQFKNNKLWVIPTVIIAVLVSIIGEYVSIKVIDIILVICIATLFYDSVFKTLENLAHSFDKKEGDK